jgi:hypothetical protein
MSYSENEKYDIFIAYYGNRENGSEEYARDIYDYINDAPIGPNKYIRAYFHPAVNPYGNFEETPMIVARTPMFLLVADQKIPTNSDGQLLKHREDGMLRNLFEEVRAFHDSHMYKSYGGDSAAKVFIADNMNPKAAERLHTVFSGRTSLNRPAQVMDWITYFYTHTYVERCRKRYEYLALKNPAEFLAGAWVPEAEELWQSLKSESIGRPLLIYYQMTARRGNASARMRIQKMTQEFNEFSRLEPKTIELLNKIV